MKTNGNDSVNPTSVFEVHRIHGQDNDVAMMKGGLTKREYFAAMAMQGILTGFNVNANDSDEQWDKVIAVESVKSADALIAALNEGKEDAK